MSKEGPGSRGDEVLELPARPRGRIKRSDALMLSVAFAVALVGGGFAASGLRDMQVLGERLRRPPSEAEEQAGRAFGVVEVEPRAGKLLCLLHAMERPDRDREPTTVWKKTILRPGSVRLADGTQLRIDPEASIEFVDVDRREVDPKDPAFVEHTAGREPFDTLYSTCLDAGRAFVDGCRTGRDSLGGCDGAPLVIAGVGSPEPLLRREIRWVSVWLGVAVSFWLLAMGALSAVGAAAGASAHALNRRAGESPFLERMLRMLDARLNRVLFGSLLLVPLGFLLGLLDVPRALHVIVPAIAVALMLFVGACVLARLWVQIRALRVMRRLEATDLAELSAGEGDVELSLEIPEDAPSIEVPFLARSYAWVQVRFEDGTVRSLPERLDVRDATGRAKLDLGAFWMGGWRHIYRFDGVRKEVSAVLQKVLATFGMDAPPEGSEVVVWSCWALVPGDELYVVGEATSVRRAVGTYRGDGGTELGARGDAPAVAVLGRKEKLRRMIRWDSALHTLVALLLVASLSCSALVAWSLLR